MVILFKKKNSGQNGGNSVQKSKTATFVNSQILSLTTQKDLGELDPNLTLTFRHITNVRQQYNTFYVGKSHAIGVFVFLFN